MEIHKKQVEKNILDRIQTDLGTPKSLKDEVCEIISEEFEDWDVFPKGVVGVGNS
jgi:hypothetical protein